MEVMGSTENYVLLSSVTECMILFFLGITCSMTTYVLYVINPAKIILEYVSDQNFICLVAFKSLFTILLRRVPEARG